MTLEDTENAQHFDELFNKYTAWLSVTAHVQCPQITCQQAEELLALIHHMNERNQVYANEWGAALDRHENDIRRWKKVSKGLTQCPKCKGERKCFSAGGSDLSGDYYTCPECLGTGLVNSTIHPRTEGPEKP